MSVVLQIHTVWPAEIRSSSSGHSMIVPEKELLHASKKNSNMRVYAIFYAWKKEHYKLWRKLLEVICKGIREKFKGDQKKVNKKIIFSCFLSLNVHRLWYMLLVSLFLISILCIVCLYILSVFMYLPLAWIKTEGNTSRTLIGSIGSIEAMKRKFWSC